MEYTVKEITHRYGVVKVHTPILSSEERTKRMNRLKDATGRFMKEVRKTKNEKKNQMAQIQT